MKKVLLILFVLAICVLAFPQGVLAFVGDSGEVLVQAQFQAQSLFFDAGTMGMSGPSDWPLYADSLTDNEKADALYLEVGSSRDWEITAYDFNYESALPHEDGKMEGDLHSLKALFELEQGGTGGSLGGTLGEIAGGFDDQTSILLGGPKTTHQTFKANIAQPVSVDDFGSADGYSITIEFVCTESLPP